MEVGTCVHVEALDLALQSINQYGRETSSKWVLEADRKTDIFISSISSYDWSKYGSFLLFRFRL